MKRIFCIGIVLALLLTGCAGYAGEVRLETREPEETARETIPPEPAGETALPEPSPEKTEFEILEYYDADGAPLGTRALAAADMDEIAAMPEAEFAAFCEEEIRPLMDGGCDYVTLDYQNGTGLVFYGGFSPIYYGAIDGAGVITRVYRYYYLEDGRLSFADPTPPPTPTPEPVRQTPDAMDYVLNTNTMKFHRPDCSSVGDIKDKNRWDYRGTREEIIAMGYDPCKRCDP